LVTPASSSNLLTTRETFKGTQLYKLRKYASWTPNKNIKQRPQSPVKLTIRDDLRYPCRYVYIHLTDNGIRDVKKVLVGALLFSVRERVCRLPLCAVNNVQKWPSVHSSVSSCETLDNGTGLSQQALTRYGPEEWMRNHIVLRDQHKH